MRLYRQRSLIVEAVEVIWPNKYELETRFGAIFFHHPDIEDSEVVLRFCCLVETEDDCPTAEEGDWIVRDTSGRIKRILREDFERQFEPIMHR